MQPHVFVDFLDRDRGMSRGSGFLARFLVSQPVSLQGTRFYKEPGDMPELGAFSRRIGELLNDIPTIDPDRGLVLPTLDFTPEAKALWVDSYNAVESELTSGGDFASIRDAASKAADNIARLAAVLHVFEYGPRGDISVQSVEAARRIVVWHAYSARALLAPLTLDRETANAATLDRWLIDRAKMEDTDEFRTRILLNGGPAGTRKKGDLDAALEVLSAHGRVRVVQIGRRRSWIVEKIPYRLFRGKA